MEHSAETKRLIVYARSLCLTNANQIYSNDDIDVLRLILDEVDEIQKLSIMLACAISQHASKCVKYLNHRITLADCDISVDAAKSIVFTMKAEEIDYYKKQSFFLRCTAIGVTLENTKIRTMDRQVLEYIVNLLTSIEKQRLLTYAIRISAPEIVKVLLELGAKPSIPNPRARSRSVDRASFTIGALLKKPNAEILKTLLEYNAFVAEHEFEWIIKKHHKLLLENPEFYFLLEAFPVYSAKLFYSSTARDLPKILRLNVVRCLVQRQLDCRIDEIRPKALYLIIDQLQNERSVLSLQLRTGLFSLLTEEQLQYEIKNVLRKSDKNRKFAVAAPRSASRF